MESAIPADWEPVVSKLKEDNMYDQTRKFQSNYSGQQQQQRRTWSCGATTNHDETATPVVRGVFCGYRVTDEEYSRLKSAHPDDEDYCI